MKQKSCQVRLAQKFFKGGQVAWWLAFILLPALNSTQEPHLEEEKNNT